MHIKNSVASETPNHYSLWSYCFALVSVFALADVFAGDFFRESITLPKIEYSMMMFAMIATVGVFASDGSPSVLAVRTYSRQKL